MTLPMLHPLAPGNPLVSFARVRARHAVLFAATLLPGFARPAIAQRDPNFPDKSGSYPVTGRRAWMISYDYTGGNRPNVYIGVNSGGDPSNYFGYNESGTYLFNGSDGKFYVFNGNTKTLTLLCITQVWQLPGGLRNPADGYLEVKRQHATGRASDVLGAGSGCTPDLPDSGTDATVIPASPTEGAITFKDAQGRTVGPVKVKRTRTSQMMLQRLKGPQLEAYLKQTSSQWLFSEDRPNEFGYRKYGEIDIRQDGSVSLYYMDARVFAEKGGEPDAGH